MYDLINILRDAAEQDATFTIGKIEIEGGELLNTYKIYPCDYETYWLKPCMSVQVPSEQGGTANGVVESVVNNECVIIKFDRDIDLNAREFTVPHGTFIHGTLPMADVEISSIGTKKNKNKPEKFKPMPVIYFQEIYREKILSNNDPNELLGENLRIYFMDDYKQNNNWTTQEHYDQIVYQMKNYARFFIEKLKEDFERVDESYIKNNTQEIIPRVKTGEYQKGGNTVAIFGRNLSGAELVISVAVKEDNRCDC